MDPRKRKKRAKQTKEPGGHTLLNPGEWIPCEVQTKNGPILFRVGMSKRKHVIIHGPPCLRFLPPIKPRNA